MREGIWILATLALAAAPVAMPSGLGAQETAGETADNSVSDPETEERAPLPPAGEELTFDEAFAPFDNPVIPELPPEAVDITEIEPERESARTLGNGVASYYGRRFHGRRTANGERFDMSALTAAHKTLPFGSRVRVTNLANGRSVVVRINDRGPFSRGRHIDLSRRAAEEIGMISAGHARVQMELLES